MATAPAFDIADPVVAGEIIIVDPATVALGERLRPVDPVWAEALGRSIERDGQITPIDVAPDYSTGGYVLAGAGGHRLTGAQMRGHDGIEARIVSSDRDTQLRREAAENLFRRANDPIERAAAIAELVRIHKLRAGIDPARTGGSVAADVRWQKIVSDEADDATATIAVAYGWSESVGEQLGLSVRTVRNDLLLYRRLAPSLIAKLRAFRHPAAANATQLRALAKLEADEQARVVDAMMVSPPRSVGDAIATVRGSNRAIDPEAKRLSAFIGAFGRMGLTEKKGALQQLPLPAGFQLVEGERPKATFSPEHERYRDEALAAIDDAREFFDGLDEDEIVSGERSAVMRKISGALQMARFSIVSDAFPIGGDA